MQYIKIPAGTTYTLVLGDDVNAMNTAKIYLLCNESGAGVTNILLPKITDGDKSLKNWWFEIFVNDSGNNASVNNIKITPNPADKINGSGAQITLNTNGANGRIVITGTTAWEFSAGTSSSGGGNFSAEIRRVIGTGGGELRITTYGGVADGLLTNWSFSKDMFSGTNYPFATPPSKAQILIATVSGGSRNITAPTVTIDDPPFPPPPDVVYIMQGIICAKVTSTDGRVAFAYFNIYHYPTG